jgi:hypothetical protein
VTLAHPVAENPSIEKDKTNKEIREWYSEEVARIRRLNDEWIEKGFSLELRAQKAWKIRHDARSKSRTMMGNQIEIKLLQRRDLVKYGNPDGPTFDFLVEKYRKLGLVGDEVYEAIIEASMKVNIGVNKGLGLK